MAAADGLDPVRLAGVEVEDGGAEVDRVALEGGPIGPELDARVGEPEVLVDDVKDADSGEPQAVLLVGLFTPSFAAISRLSGHESR